MKEIIYVDHSATTYVKKEVLDKMLPYFTVKYGNASSIYSKGIESKEAIDKARNQVSEALGCCECEIYFTAGGSESDNLALLGIARANKAKGNHIITTKIEHLGILETCKRLEKEGFEVTYLDVDNTGLVDIEDVERAIKSTTILISVMFANNEIGTIQPIEAIGRIARCRGVYFHTDAVQAIGNVHIDTRKMHIDALSLSAHKFYGPKGVGALYIRNGINFDSIITGGHQEQNKRAGTENVPGIVGLGAAIELANNNIDCYNEKLYRLREYCIEQIMKNIPGVILNGHRTKRLPGNINISIKGIQVGTLLLMLNDVGICASSGSACTSGNTNPSHVLVALGMNSDISYCSLRITLGEENTCEDIDYIICNLYRIVHKLRRV
ncbi:MAG: cysteine desulfurase NifS [Clostridia bacterium]|nr:cysteine desulfurase NifS [Clostridia bacterium]MDD4386925.1 cysteine desulfurase NifS [Clostridia bacterium]